MTLKINTVYGEKIVESKICNSCGEEKLLDYFPFRYYDGKKLSQRRGPCKKCESRNSKISRKLYKENKLSKPKICQMCSKKKNLVLDHDHDTEKFRGWICAECNHGLGLLGDNLEGLNRALRYLKKNDNF